MTASLDFFAEDLLKGEAWGRSWEQDLSDPARVTGLPQETRPLENRVFDLASLTKVIVTSSLLVELAESEGRAPLVPWSEQKLVRVLKELKSTPLENLTLRECWEHRSGLQPFLEFSSDRSRFFKISERSDVHSKILAKAVEVAARGDFDPVRGSVYSDLGHALLGVFLERTHGKTLDVLWDAWKAKHLSRAPETLQRLAYQRENFPRIEAISTEARHPSGVVNDDNTYVMGGVASHAGLFANARDVALWIHAVLAWARVSPWARAWLETPCPEGQRFVMGWDTPSGKPESQAGGEAAP
ncbi:MAG: serine hydrolase, partial [Bdellovibrionota bacterium]